MTRRYTRRTTQERIEALKKLLATKETYHQKHLDGLAPLRNKIQHLENSLVPKPENPTHG